MVKLEADLKNLEADLSATDLDALTLDERGRLERFREKVIYLKVKMKKPHEDDGERTGLDGVVGADTPAALNVRGHAGSTERP